MRLKMTEVHKRRSVDLLVEQFWRKGYLTLSRKFGTYLPEPTSVGGFDVDIIARQKNKYAIGITVSEEELKSIDLLIAKLQYLASRQTRRGNLPVTLFVGTKKENFQLIKKIIEQLDEEIQKNIKLVEITERSDIRQIRKNYSSPPLFS